MQQLELLYEGKAKRIFRTDDADAYIMEYKDTATAFNGEKKEELAGKGVLNCSITCILFELLEQAGIKTHMLRRLDDTHVLVRKVEIVPLEVIVRNVAAGSFSKRFGVSEGTALKCSTVEFSYKNDDLGDPMINDSHIIALGIATKEELCEITDMALKINQILCDFFDKTGIRLIDFKVEIGRAKDGTLLLADEISPDSCRLWDKSTTKSWTKTVSAETWATSSALTRKF